MIQDTPLILETQHKCPSCGSKTRPDVMPEEGFEYDIRVCTGKCEWWG